MASLTRGHCQASLPAWTAGDEQWWPVVVGDRGLLGGISSKQLFFCFLHHSLCLLHLILLLYILLLLSPNSGCAAQMLLHRKPYSLRCLPDPICVAALYYTLNLQTLCAQPLGLITNEVGQLKSYCYFFTVVKWLIFFYYPLSSLEFGQPVSSPCYSSFSSSSSLLFVLLSPPSNKERPRIRIYFHTQWGSVCICNIWPLSTQRLCSFVFASWQREASCRAIWKGGRVEEKKENYGCSLQKREPPPGLQMKMICSRQQDGGWLTLKPPPTLSRWFRERKGWGAVERDSGPTGLSF